MAILFTPRDRTTHWYTRTGELVTAAEGGLASARRFGHLPSVTNVLSLLAKPGLVQWQIGQGIIAAARTQRAPDEAEEYYVRRVSAAANDASSGAAQLGARIHDAIDMALGGEAYPDDLRPFVAPALEIASSVKVIGREVRLVSPEFGIAGTADLVFAGGVLDWKTRKTTPGKRVERYDEHAIQASVYAAMAHGVEALDTAKVLVVVISTTEPERPPDVQQVECPRACWAAFCGLLASWRYLRRYDPRDGFWMPTQEKTAKNKTTKRSTQNDHA